MAKVTEKNTKKEILEALREAEARLAERRAANTTTADVVKVKEVEAQKEDAKEIVGMNILSDEVVNKYNSLISTIDMLEREIQELHEVKTGLDTLEALMIVHANKERDLNEQHAATKASFEEMMEEKKAIARADIEALQAKYSKLSAELSQEYSEAKKELERNRAREAEEYEYNLKRKRAIENDNWEDEKATREKELAEKEAAVVKREFTVNELVAEVASLNSIIDALKATHIEDVQKALKEGEAKAEKTCAIKTAAIKKDAEWQAEMSKQEIDTLKASLNAKEQETAELRAKLDDAYTRIQQMAIEQSKASSPRLVETTK